MSTVIDFGVSEDERLLDDSARRFADEQLRPTERRHEAARGYPDEVRARHHALGFATMHVPESAGGVGLPLAVAARVWERIAAADPAAPIGLGVPGLASLARSRSGAMPARDRQPGAIVVEPIGGRDRQPGAIGIDLIGAASGLAGDHSEIAWVPCARPAWLAIISPTGVELATDVNVRTIDRPALGLRAAGASAVSASAREPIGDAAEAARWLVELRVFAAACMLGAARDAADYARSYSKVRIAFGKPIAHHQGLAFALVETATELDAAGLLLAAAAASEEPIAVAAAHAFVTRIALRAVERSLQALGGHGYLYDHPIEKRMRDVRALASLYGGATTAERDAADRVLAVPDPLELR